ncbi:MAG: hypothetical protein JW959_09285, partial [Pirellulales bacterium]|nr:hypothetical protein [Pirellulales bacterium]
MQLELASGNYASEDELLLTAVRLLNQREKDLRDFKTRLQGRLERLATVHRGLSQFSRFTAKMGLSPSAVKGTG